MRSLLTLALALAFTAAAHAAPPPMLGAQGLVALVKEGLAEDLRAGSLETAAALAEGLEDGAVTDPALVAELAAAGREALRSARRADPEARALLTRLSAPLAAGAPPAVEGGGFVFPRDEGAHKLLSEWWYWNGHLKTPEGRSFGFQYCFFRTRVGVHFLHAAITDEATGRFDYFRTYHRPSKARSSEQKLDMDYSGSTARGVGPAQVLDFQVDDWKVHLALTPTRPQLDINGDGVIDMPEGTTSRYYSRTLLATRGSLTRGAERFEVSGQSWFDHQWGNFVSLLRPWDWFCIQMDDGTAYNLFSFREGWWHSQRADVNVLEPSEAHHVSKGLVVERDAWWQSPKSGKWYVSDWTLRLPQRGEVLKVTTTQANQEMPRVGWYDFAPSYWEGRMTVTRTKADGSVDHGVSYCEHFPYSRPWED